MSYSKNIDLDFFERVSENDIHNYVTFLKKSLPSKCTRRNYQLTNDMLGISFEIGVRKEELESKLQGIADKMRAHLLITRPIKVFTIPTVEGGKFELLDGKYCIYVNSEL